MNQNIFVTSLGQSGFKLTIGNIVIYIDPYLSERVERIEGKHLQRMTPIKLQPGEIDDANYVLISHIHMDHCDPDTLIPMAKASNDCKFICPNEVRKYMLEFDIGGGRMITANTSWIRISENVQIMPIPAAHEAIEYDEDGYLRFVGYVIDYQGKRIYHSGDTSPHDQIISALEKLQPIDVAFLPVNERNFYKEKLGIIGNMSIREAFQMASDINVRTLIPIHWDMFEVNSVFRDEIELLYNRLKPDFELILEPSQI